MATRAGVLLRRCNRGHDHRAGAGSARSSSSPAIPPSSTRDERSKCRTSPVSWAWPTSSRAACAAPGTECGHRAADRSADGPSPVGGALRSRSQGRVRAAGRAGATDRHERSTAAALGGDEQGQAPSARGHARRRSTTTRAESLIDTPKGIDDVERGRGYCEAAIAIDGPTHARAHAILGHLVRRGRRIRN